MYEHVMNLHLLCKNALGDGCLQVGPRHCLSGVLHFLAFSNTLHKMVYYPCLHFIGILVSNLDEGLSCVEFAHSLCEYCPRTPSSSHIKTISWSYEMCMWMVVCLLIVCLWWVIRPDCRIRIQLTFESNEGPVVFQIYNLRSVRLWRVNVMIFIS